MTELATSRFIPIKEMNVIWRSEGEGSSSPALVSEISRTGAFIKTAQPPSVGTILSLRLELPSRELTVRAFVRRTVPGQGMGVEFGSLKADDRARLEMIVLQAERDVKLGINPEARTLPQSPAPSAPIAMKTEIYAPAEGQPRNRRIDRRARHRHKFVAEVTVTEPESGRRVQGQTLDIGKAGCFVSTGDPFPPETLLELTITRAEKVFHAQAKVASMQPGRGMGMAFTSVELQECVVLDEWLAASMERTWLASNRRRSQRVVVSLPVRVEAKNVIGNEVAEDTKTVSVSAHGALLRLEMDVAKGQTIVLRNPATKMALECSVDYLGNAQNGLREVGVSFVVPNQRLWQISFPPADWGPQDPDAKKI